MNRAAHIRARVAAVSLALAICAAGLWQGRAPSTDPHFIAQVQDYPLASTDPRLAGLAPLMARASAREASPLGDAPPRLVGIAGRLPDDAEVLVRLRDGSTATISPGEAAQGWRAVAVTAQSVTFEREGRRETVMLEAGNPAQ